MEGALFYIAAVINTAGYIFLIYKIWSTKSCAGISGKAHILYVLAYIGKSSNLFCLYLPPWLVPYTIVNLTYLVAVCIVVLSLFVFFRKTRERHYDTFRTELLLICCIALALIVHQRFEGDEIAWNFGTFLEVVAMLPQFSLTLEARRIHTHVVCYLVAIAAAKLLELLYHPYEVSARFGQYGRKLAMAGAIVQLILFLDFFSLIVPYKLRLVKASPEIELVGRRGADDVANGDVEGSAYRADGCLKSNMSSVVLTPGALLADSSDKVNLLKGEEAK